MIEKFNGIFLLIVFILHFIGHGVYGFRCVFGTKSFLDQYAMHDSGAIMTRFFGSIFILGLYVLITWRLVTIGNIVRSSFAKLYCYSFATAFFLYVAVNMGMVLGLIPIVGAPLPIMSYGGSSMMAIMFGLGIAMSSKIHKDQIPG